MDRFLPFLEYAPGTQQMLVEDKLEKTLGLEAGRASGSCRGEPMLTGYILAVLGEAGHCLSGPFTWIQQADCVSLPWRKAGSSTHQFPLSPVWFLSQAHIETLNS